MYKGILLITHLQPAGGHTVGWISRSMTGLAGKITVKIIIEEMEKSIFHRRNEPGEVTRHHRHYHHSFDER
jgi:hypothetical protein